MSVREREWEGEKEREKKEREMEKIEREGTINYPVEII